MFINIVSNYIIILVIELSKRLKTGGNTFYVNVTYNGIKISLLDMLIRLTNSFGYVGEFLAGANAMFINVVPNHIKIPHQIVKKT